MSTIQKIHKFDIELEVAVDMISKRLWKLGYASVKGRSISIANARRPLGNGAWGMVEYLQRNGYHLTDFAKYQQNMFGADQLKFYPHLRKAA